MLLEWKSKVSLRMFGFSLVSTLHSQQGVANFMYLFSCVHLGKTDIKKGTPRESNWHTNRRCRSVKGFQEVSLRVHNTELSRKKKKHAQFSCISLAVAKCGFLWVSLLLKTSYLTPQQSLTGVAHVFLLQMPLDGRNAVTQEHLLAHATLMERISRITVQHGNLYVP